jgi:hypothetical protein
MKKPKRENVHISSFSLPLKKEDNVLETLTYYDFEYYDYYEYEYDKEDVIAYIGDIKRQKERIRAIEKKFEA